MKQFFTLVIICLSLNTFLSAQQGLEYLDTTFNQNGPVKGRINHFVNTGVFTAKAMTTDLQNRIIVASCSANYVFASRYLPSGIVDSTFGINGVSQIYFPGSPSYYVDATSMVRLSDGKFLIGGSLYNGTAKNMLLIKLTQAGKIDSTWNLDGVADYDLGASQEDQINDMALTSNGSLVVVGKSGVNGACVRFRTDGTLDPTFGGGDGIVTWFSGGVRDEASSLTLDNDTIYIASRMEIAAGAASINYSVLKLAPDGSQTGFGKRDFIATGSRYTTTIYRHTDGKIVLGGYTGSDFLLYRLLPDGNQDATFGTAPGGQAQIPVSSAGYPAYLGEILYDNKDKKYVLAGYGNVGSTKAFTVVRLNYNGSPNNTFANAGKLQIIPQAFASCSGYAAAVSHDNRLLLSGTEGSSVAVLKINLKPVINIIGKEVVYPQTTEEYEIKVPASWPYQYRWTFSGTNHYFVPDSSGTKILLLFDEGATDGVLTCYAHIGLTDYASVELPIKINNNPSAAALLAENQCPKVVTDCYDNYISHFKLNLISNDSSTCNTTGYSDFTRSQWVDTLLAGSVYAASVRTESSESIKYAAIWIDYNNDGTFDSTSEFVTQVYGPGPILNLQNIILKNKEGYTGPKRLRVRCNPYGFTPGDACGTEGELGETEDYMIIIQTQDKLEAPEIFTPNEDGKNDYFVIRGVDPAFENTLTIFDRYGEVIFSASNYENNWDGKSNDGGKVNPGTYYYYFKNNENFIRGFVEIRY